MNEALEMRGMAMRFGGVHVFEGVDLTVRPGQVTACIGPNGAGKTTLVNVVCGVYKAYGGTVILDGAPLADPAPHDAARRGIARTFQDVRIFPFLSARENVLIAMPDQAGARLRGLFMPGAGVAAQERRNIARAQALLATMGLTEVADRTAAELPFGQQKLLGVLRAVATGARYLLLDEPAAGVEGERVERLTALIKRLAREERRGVLLIEHNVEVVRGVADDVVVLQGGGVLASGTCERVLRDERVIREYLGRLYDA